MSFRARLLLALASATLLSLAVLAVGVRRQLTARLVAQHERRVATLAHVAIEDLTRESATVSARLTTLARALVDDNRFRLGVGGGGDRQYVLDWAGDAMRITGLSLLQVQDETGRIVSSGHFRQEFDRVEPALPRLLAQAVDKVTVVRARTPDGSFLALAREDSVTIGGRRFTLVGGTTIDRALLARFARGDEESLSLVTPDGAFPPDTLPPTVERRVAAEQDIAYIGTGPGDSLRLAPARVVVTHSNAELDALRADVNRWFGVAVATAAIIALAFAAWLSTGLSEPIAALARATSTIQLEGPELELATGRDDEIGALARRFGAMARRLRAGALELRDAERRATVGEMARQVNHDIKNGLIPIRNVVRHLAEVQERQPDQLPTVFGERRGTLESSIGYLDTLARNYARLTPAVMNKVFDAGAVAREAAQSAGTDAVAVRANIADGLPPVHGDPVVLRRILDNLLRNAIESLADGGSVTLEMQRRADGGIRITVADTGRGMSESELAHAFDDFHTTKAGGTGLGLSVVRRLTADLNADLRVDSAPGRGTTFTIDLASA